MSVLFQMSASSLRQLSIFSEPAWAATSPVSNAARATPPRIHAIPVFILPSSLAGLHARARIDIRIRAPEARQNPGKVAAAFCDKRIRSRRIETAGRGGDRDGHVVLRLVQGGGSRGLSDRGQPRDDALGAGSQFGVVGSQVDHQSVM